MCQHSLYECFCSPHTHTNICRHVHIRCSTLSCSEGCVRMGENDLESEVRLCEESSVCEQEVWDVEHASFFFPQWDKLKRTHGSHTLGFSLFLIYVQIHWCFNISTLCQLGVIRRLPYGSHKRRQLRAIACSTNMRCIVLIKEALEYRLHMLIWAGLQSSAHTYINMNMLKLTGIVLKLTARTNERTHIPLMNCFSVLSNQLSSYFHNKTCLQV